MNLTIRQSKQGKQAFIHRATLGPRAAPRQPAKKENIQAERKDCGPLFFVNCLNANHTESSELGDNFETLQVHKKPDGVLEEKPKGKISLSITHKHSQKFQTPRQEIQGGQQSSGKPTVQASPVPIRQKIAEISRIKLTLNSTLTPEVKSKDQPSFCESKQAVTRNSIEPVQSEAQSRQLRPNIVFTNQKVLNSNEMAIQPSSQKVMIGPKDEVLNIGQKYSTAEKRQVSDQQLQRRYADQQSQEPVINWKERLKDRRGIGEYAKTIKTFNGSEARENYSEVESIVLERGIHHFNQSGRMAAPLNRGSIKECPVEEQTLKRGYGSVGDELHNAHLDSRFSKCLDQAIQEDLYDSEI